MADASEIFPALIYGVQSLKVLVSYFQFRLEAFRFDFEAFRFFFADVADPTKC